jgi:hypothetical protein
MLDLSAQPSQGSRERGTERPSLRGSHEALAAGGVEHELYAARGAVLLEPRDGVDRAPEPGDGFAQCALGPKLEARRDGGMMGVKDDLHGHLETANDILRAASVGGAVG